MIRLACLNILFLLSILIEARIEDGNSEALLEQMKCLLESLRDHQIDPSTESMTDRQIVDYVNGKQDFWKAEYHDRLASYPENVRLGLMGVHYTRVPIIALKHKSATRFLNITIPESFDARDWWPECKGKIEHIRDQSSCGSCWAVAATEAFSDRVCVATKGKLKVDLSASDLLSCCKNCGMGCQGGYPYEAWKYFVQEGVVTGGDYKGEGCKPYPFPPCHNNQTKHEGDVCKDGMFHTPQCQEECQNQVYEKGYKKDKVFALTSYSVEKTEEAIQKELITYGPIEVAFEVYSDFLHYKHGIYMHTAGPLVGGHAVKLIGWGYDSEKKLPFWTIANSWGQDWGDQGFFKIVRGLDECQIESGAVAGIPKIQ